MSHKCDNCGRTFDTKHGLGIHKGQAHGPDDPPWRDAGIDDELVDQARELSTVGDIIGGETS